MPLIVRELVVRASVTAGSEEPTPETSEDRRTDREQLVSQIAAEVLRILREREER